MCPGCTNTRCPCSGPVDGASFYLVTYNVHYSLHFQNRDTAHYYARKFGGSVLVMRAKTARDRRRDDTKRAERMGVIK